MYLYTKPRLTLVRVPIPMYVTICKTKTTPGEKPHPCVCYHWQDLDSPLWETPPLCMLPLTRPGQPLERNSTPVYVTTDKTWTAPGKKPHPCVCYHWQDLDSPLWETPPLCMLPLTRPGQPLVRNPTPVYVTTDKTWTAPGEKLHPCVCYHWQDLDSPW